MLDVVRVGHDDVFGGESNGENGIKEKREVMKIIHDRCSDELILKKDFRVYNCIQREKYITVKPFSAAVCPVAVQWQKGRSSGDGGMVSRTRCLFTCGK
jgi:hypothetical protein